MSGLHKSIHRTEKENQTFKSNLYPRNGLNHRRRNGFGTQRNNQNDCQLDKLEGGYNARTEQNL